ncbi:MAG: hypothetical protein MK101_12575, partial [Phycisphaerales bacterium]|nr:hypothetical protein [Phycisphaerales bacterium]
MLKTRPPLLVTLSALLMAGCGALQRPSRLRPPPHPLLEAVPFPETGRPRLQPRRNHPKPSLPAKVVAARPEKRPTSTGPTPQSKIPAARPPVKMARILALEGRREIDGAPANDRRLLKAAFDLQATPRVTGVGRPLDSAEPPKPGDVVLFAGEGYGPRAGVVVQVGRDGLLEALLVTRGAVRRVVADRRRPHTRRVGARIRNSFIRPLRRGERHDNRVLAGQLLA